MDKKAFSVSKPTLLKSISRKVILKLNIVISCQETLAMLSAATARSFHFNVVYDGIDFTSPYLGKRLLLRCFQYFGAIFLRDIFLDPILMDVNELCSSLPCLAANGTAWINTSSSLSSRLYAVVLSKFLHQTTSPIKFAITQFSGDFLAALLSLNISVSAFSVFPLKQPIRKNILDSNNIFGEFLCANSTVLEYLELRWYFFTIMPLESIQKCTRLRVLSITVKTNTVLLCRDMNHAALQIFDALQQLHNLEYFEWCEDLNLVVEDLISMRYLLSNCLPRLLHFHLKLKYLLLFTMDLKYELLNELLNPLLKEKTGTTWCSTYKFSINNVHFKKWLEDIRPQTCFNCHTNPNISHLQFIL